MRDQFHLVIRREVYDVHDMPVYVVVKQPVHDLKGGIGEGITSEAVIIQEAAELPIVQSLNHR